MAQPSRTGYVCRERVHKPSQLRLWAPRCPMTQLPDEFRVTKDNPKPTLVHFAIPTDGIVLELYAAKNNCVHPKRRGFLDLAKAVELLSQHVEYELYACWPFRYTADCGMIIVLYDNLDMKQKRLIEKDEEDVIEMVQEALGLDKSMRPKWYFDWHDPWLPDSDDEEESSDEGVDLADLDENDGDATE